MGILKFLFGKKDHCKGCIYNNEDKAHFLFYYIHCDLWDCQMSGDNKCKFKKTK